MWFKLISKNGDLHSRHCVRGDAEEAREKMACLGIETIIVEEPDLQPLPKIEGVCEPCYGSGWLWNGQKCAACGGTGVSA